MNIQDIIPLLGKPINTPEMQAFFEQYGFTYPKTDTLSAKSAINMQVITVGNGKSPAELNFYLLVHHDRCQPVPAERKNRYYPVFVHAIVHADAPTGMPFGIQTDWTYEQLCEVLGPPAADDTVREEDYFQAAWKLDCGNNPDSCISIFCTKSTRYKKHNGIKIHVSLKQKTELNLFYSKLAGETCQNIQENAPYSTIANLMFLRWLIERDYMAQTAGNQAVLAGIKSGGLPVSAYLQHSDTGYVYMEDIVPERQQAVDAYWNNRSDDGQYFLKDFEALFLSKQEFARIYEDDAPGGYLDPGDALTPERCGYTESNYQKVKAMLDKRHW